MGGWRVFDFLIHLRLHYQVFILVAPYLCGGLLADQVAWDSYLLQFFNVHVLLFGGATAYNSFWDKDEGPIGGLRHPPTMQPWMHRASLGMQAFGLLVALAAGPIFAGIYAVAVLLFWLYSTPVARWKGRPTLSLVAIGVSTGTASLLMGRLAASSTPLTAGDAVAALAVCLTLLSLYPVSQIYQLAADRQRGDKTFAIAYGLRGVRLAFGACYFPGVALLSLAFGLDGMPALALVFATLGSAWGVVIWLHLRSLKGHESEYTPVMRLKYATSAAFVSVLAIGLVFKHNGVAI